MSIFIWFLVFVIALAVLVLSSDWFVGAAEKIGLSLGWPPFVVGVIIIGIGTSLPELMSSIMAVVQEQNQIVAGNVFGSNITNIFLIAGLAGVLGKSFEIHFDFMKADAIFLIGSTVLVSFSVMDGSFHWTEGILVLVLLAFYILSSMKHEATEAAERPTGEMVPLGTADRLTGGNLLWGGLHYPSGDRHICRDPLAGLRGHRRNRCRSGHQPPGGDGHRPSRPEKRKPRSPLETSSVPIFSTSWRLWGFPPLSLGSSPQAAPLP
jgi:Ca2+/Na+ antiporter